MHVKRFGSNKKVVGAMFMAAGAVALVGIGAGASFTDSVSATQHISTGTLSMSISSVDQNGNPDGTVSRDGKSISWDLSNSGSTIDVQHTVTVTNTGSLPLDISSVSFQPADANDTPLADDVQVQLDQITGYSVNGLQNTSLFCSGCQLAPGATFTFPLNFSAPDLGNKDEGQTISPSLTLGASELAGHHNAPANGGPSILASAAN